jgi:hypothetical protein
LCAGAVCRREQVEPGWLLALAALPAEQLHAAPSGVTQPGWPPSLAAFVRTAASLSLPRQPCAVAPATPQECTCAPAPALMRALSEGVPAKKRHEVREAARLWRVWPLKGALCSRPTPR